MMEIDDQPASTAGDPLLPSQVAAHYDDLDRHYREFWGEHVHHGLWSRRDMSPEEATRNLVHFVAKEAGVQPGNTVCDVGCGYGGTARLLAREYQAQVTGLTISEAQFRHSRTVDPESPNPTYYLCDWLRNQLEPMSYDAVISIESSEHMPDLVAFFEQAFRVARPGGRLVICAWLSRERIRGWEKRRLIDPICREGRMRAMETASEYDRVARSVGFVPGNTHDVSRQVQRTWSICAGRVLKGVISNPDHRRFLFREGGPNRVFAVTLARIWLAYATGSMRYGVLTYQRPS